MTFLRASAVALFLWAYIPASLASSFDRWFGLYGEQITFDVYRKDEDVGTYVVRFSERGTDFLVEVEMNLEIPILLGWTYDYQYSASEVWQDDSLNRLDVLINDNGDTASFVAKNIDSELRPEAVSDAFEESAPAKLPIILTHHYNVDVLDKNRVFNTLTARENLVEIIEVESSTMKIDGADRAVRQFDYLGELTDTSVWYDDKGRWVKMIFLGTDGTPIELRCTRCGS
ncbi:MAG: DUF6134 family protein [Pseudomonadota bacterium]